MSDAVYTDLESVKKAFPGEWDDNEDEWVEESIPLVSSMIRKLFKPYGLKLDLLIANDDVELILVKAVATNMIVRQLKSRAEGTAGGLDYTNLSQTAGVYSQSISTTDSNSSFFIKSGEKELLGVPTIGIGTITDVYIERGPRYGILS